MEGLIPFVYRAIIQYKNGERLALAGSSWFGGDVASPSSSYMRLPGDSGRFIATNLKLSGLDEGARPTIEGSTGNQRCEFTSQREVK